MKTRKAGAASQFRPPLRDPEQLQKESLSGLTTITPADSAVDGVSKVAVASGMAHRYAALMVGSIQSPTHPDLCLQFEALIDVHERRGYSLSSWDLSTVAAPGVGVLHTIIAVFKVKSE